MKIAALIVGILGGIAGFIASIFGLVVGGIDAAFGGGSQMPGWVSEP